MATTGINYKIDKIANNERLKLLQLGDTYLISPVSLAIINYCHLAKIPHLNDINDIEELWFRVCYIRNFGFEMWPTANGKQHPFEPFYDDLVTHKGLLLPDTQYMPRKQWINFKIDFFIENNNAIAASAKLQKVTEAVLGQRDKLNDAYIEQETGRKTVAPNHSAQQSNNKNANESPKPQNVNDGGVPDIIVQQHNENVLKIAIDRRSKNLPLNEEQAKLFEEFAAKYPDKLQQIINPPKNVAPLEQELTKIDKPDTITPKKPVKKAKKQVAAKKPSKKGKK